MNLNIRRNAATSIAEAAISAVAYFLLFRIVVSKLGQDALGIWSLVAAAAAMARLGDMGLSAGINRFVATASAEGDYRKARSYLDTAIISVSSIYIVASTIIYPLAYFALPFLLTGKALNDGRDLIPYSLATLVVNSASAISLSTLSGLQQGYKKSVISIFSLLILIPLPFFLSESMGIASVGIAQTFQSIFSLISSLYILNRELSSERKLPRWSAKAFKEMLSYTAQLQVGGVSALVFEPLVKSVMAKFGGIGALASYEIALRLVTLSKNLIVAANQSLVSAIANVHASKPSEVRALYNKTFKLTAASAAFVYVAICAATPIISRLVLHKLDSTFIYIAIGLGAAQCINTVVVPIYMLGLGVGYLRYNVLSHIFMTVCSPALGALIGFKYGALGVITGVCAGLIFGATILAFGYYRHFRPILNTPNQSS